MPRTIADASTLIHLAYLGHLDLLQTFHEHVLVPTAVWEEVVVQGEGLPAAAELQEARKEGWIEVREPSSTRLLELLGRDLGAGEVEAIALATEHPDRILLVDETAARDLAEVHDLEKTGVVGILLRAALEDRMPSLRDAL